MCCAARACACAQGLRLHDNPALLDACKQQHVFPIFIIDPFFLKDGSYK